jgi:hypothetical protein
LLIFVLHDESGQIVIAALREKDEEDHGEESAFITLARCPKNSEKIKKFSECCQFLGGGIWHLYGGGGAVPGVGEDGP